MVDITYRNYVFIEMHWELSLGFSKCQQICQVLLPFKDDHIRYMNINFLIEKEGTLIEKKENNVVILVVMHGITAEFHNQMWLNKRLQYSVGTKFVKYKLYPVHLPCMLHCTDWLFTGQFYGVGLFVTLIFQHGLILFHTSKLYNQSCLRNK